MNLPPKICVPRRAKMPRKSKRRTRSETMASIELMSEASRFFSDFQYLWGGMEGGHAVAGSIVGWVSV